MVFFIQLLIYGMFILASHKEMCKFSERMREPVKKGMVFVKEECGGVDIKEELLEEQDPLSLEKGKTKNSKKDY